MSVSPCPKIKVVIHYRLNLNDIKTWRSLPGQSRTRQTRPPTFTHTKILHIFCTDENLTPYLPSHCECRSTSLSYARKYVRVIVVAEIAMCIIVRSPKIVEIICLCFNWRSLPPLKTYCNVQKRIPRVWMKFFWINVGKKSILFAFEWISDSYWVTDAKLLYSWVWYV